MRPIDLIVVHCTATPEGKQQTVADITRMHKQRGFSTIGYHWLIGINGEIWPGRPEAQPGAHVENYNRKSIGVSYVGGVKAAGKTAKDTRTPAQKAALVKLLRELIARFPKARILGHRDLSRDRNNDGVITPDEWIKQCPCFSAITEYRSIGLPVAPKKPALVRDAQVFPDGPQAPVPKPAPPAEVTPDVRIGPGSPKELVIALQKILNARNYPSGAADGLYGRLTRDAVLALKADQGLDTSDATITLDEAKAAPPRIIESRVDATVADLRTRGSKTVEGADKVEVASVSTGGLLGFAGLTSYIDQAETASGIWGRVRMIAEPFSGLWQWASDNIIIVLGAVAAAAFFYARRVKRKRLEEFKAGKLQ